MKKIEILLVEDNPDDLEMSLHASRKGKKAPIASRSPAMAGKLSTLPSVSALLPTARWKDAPRVIRLDLKMQRVDGLKVLKRLKIKR